MTSRSPDSNTLQRHVKLEDFAISFGKKIVMCFLKNPVLGMNCFKDNLAALFQQTNMKTTSANTKASACPK